MMFYVVKMWQLLMHTKCKAQFYDALSFLSHYVVCECAHIHAVLAFKASQHSQGPACNCPSNVLLPCIILSTLEEVL